MTPSRHLLYMPDLGLGQVSASVWLVEVGEQVGGGDRLLEVVAGSVTVDLPAPATGVLAEQCVSEGDSLRIGQLLAVVEAR
jgi:2-oxoglutarate dehydrogenase E2 component (dihydrolipoamide succinyltransferase)